MRPILAAILFTPALALAQATDVGSATVPLAQVLDWKHAAEAAQTPAPRPPPVAGAVTKLELSGRLLDDAIDLTAHVEAVVVQGGAWTTLPLLPLEHGAALVSVPALDDGLVSVQGGALVLTTDAKGAHALEAALRVRAQENGHRRRVEIRCGAAAAAVLRLHADESLFRVTAPDAVREPDALVLYPEHGRFVVEWERRGEAAAPAAVRAPVEPAVPHAYASVVATLEGRRVVRALWELRLEGRRTIVIAPAPGQHLERVWVNGVPVPFDAQAAQVEVAVAPARGGDDAGTVEALLNEAQGGFALSGRLTFAVPTVSWSVDSLDVSLHLPAVFDYAWRGGSLAPHEDVPAPRFSRDLPVPGKALAFHQELVAGAVPDVTVSYTVDLAGAYYRAER
jgi:hypothetical protein